MKYYNFKLVNPIEVFVNAIPVKVRTNNKKCIAHGATFFYGKLLKQEIKGNREVRGKNLLKEKDNMDADNTLSFNGDSKEFTDDIPLITKIIKCSTTDPESGWFRKRDT